MDQLLECCSNSVRRNHHRTYWGLGQQDEKTVMKQLKEVAVKKQNIAVKLSGIKQDQGGGPVEGKALAVA